MRRLIEAKSRAANAFMKDYERTSHAKMSKVPESDYKKTSKYAANSFARLMNDAGMTVEVLPTDGWGVTPMSVDLDGVRFPVIVAYQEFPKGDTFLIQFQSPMSGGDKEKWSAMAKSIYAGLKKSSNAMSKFGTVTVTKGGARKWPELSIRIDDDKKDVAKKSSGIPQKMGVLTSNVLSRLVHDGAAWVDDDMGESMYVSDNLTEMRVKEVTLSMSDEIDQNVKNKNGNGTEIDSALYDWFVKKFGGKSDYSVTSKSKAMQKQRVTLDKPKGRSGSVRITMAPFGDYVVVKSDNGGSGKKKIRYYSVK